jgi:hypothetical protein
MEEGCEETFLCLSLNCEACRFTVPPAIALLNYISSGILWRIFFQTEIFAGFSLHNFNFAVRISEAATDRGHYNFRIACSSFRVRRSSVRCSVAHKAVA